MNDLIIFGASGFGWEVAWLVERINKKSPTWNFWDLWMIMIVFSRLK